MTYEMRYTHILCRHWCIGELTLRSISDGDTRTGTAGDNGIELPCLGVGPALFDASDDVLGAGPPAPEGGVGSF